MPKYIKKGNKLGWVQDGYEWLFDEDFDALFYSPDCTVIKDQKRIKVYHFNRNGEVIYVKRYNPYSIWSSIEGSLNGSKAFRSWQGAKLLIDKGLNTAHPLAAIEHMRWGLLRESFYVTRAIEDSWISVDYYKEKLIDKAASITNKRLFLRSLAKLFSDIHGKGIYHNDLKDYNILVRVEDGHLRFFLLDLEGIKEYETLPESKRLKNLIQLNRTLGRLVNNAAKIAFLKEYCGAGEWKELARSIVKESLRIDMEKGS